ncbi:MAG TPA: AI-2E family transporter [Gemmatimonadaceae bacterium]|nr:AI-2E family transporter [Gemmatimonadaceae bacterium]
MSEHDGVAAGTDEKTTSPHDPLSPIPDSTPAGPPTPPKHRDRRRRNIGWRSRDILRATVLVMVVWLTFKLLWFANELVLVAFIGMLFGLAVSAGVDRLERRHVPRGVGAAFIVLSFFATLYGLGAVIAPTISEQASVLKQRLPDAVEQVEQWFEQRHGGVFGALLGERPEQQATTDSTAKRAARTAAQTKADTAGPVAPESPLRERLAQQLSGATRYLFPFVSSTLAVLAGLAIILFVAIYVAADTELYHRGLMHLFPHRTRPLAGEVLTTIATQLRKWLTTQLIAMAVIGVVSTIVLLILDVKAAFALGLIAGLLEFIPTVGPVLSAVPAIAMGFLDSPEKALYVAIAYLTIQQLEGHILIPLLMKGGMDLPPVLTILAQALMALLFGFLGLMVAVPMLAAVMVPVKMLYVERVVGDEIMQDDDDDDDDDESG